ncbi:MAG: ATP synthase F1 subunit epsilon [Coriobacteriia bacterium]|nr:ATP synthase F1 subunit epsilon [Coriobacteriia bacterium]MBS5479114.1 ATP synthase F1 subunit epsilon [Coriobacteriia bacterium]
MADTLKCKIVTPVKAVFSEEASYVGLPGELGGFGVMRGHEPFVSSLTAGVVRVTTQAGGRGHETKFVVSGGYTEVKDNEVIVLADNAQALEDLDVTAVRSDLADAEAHLNALGVDSPEYAYYKGQKAWFELLIAAATGEQA